jgi:hypothetical protein
MPWTNVQLLLNSRDATGGTPQIVPSMGVSALYNNLTFNSQNQNLVQGQIHSVSVNEVNFPYDIPNIQVGFNEFIVDTVAGSVFLPVIVITPGFYSGIELAAAVNAAITAAGAIAPTPLLPAQMPTLTYDPTTNRFTFNPPTVPGGAQYEQWFFQSPYTYPNGLVTYPTTLNRDIMSIMGFVSSQTPRVNTVGPVLLTSGSAPLIFTRYVDICSPQLCQYQYFRDGSTTNLARRSDVICRLYISNNVATQEEEGARPFVINRQFNNARVMRWNSGNSVGTMDIQLYDDNGQPLQITWLPRAFQITFNVYEQDKDSTTY